MSKKLFLLVIFLMLVPFIPHHLTGAEAAEEGMNGLRGDTIQGTCGTNVKYTISGNTISFSKASSGSDALWG